jgi:Icc-related predicted phosphoesterase
VDLGRETDLAVIGDVHAHWRHLDFVLTRIAEAHVDGILLVGDLGSHDLAHARRRTPERDARYLVSVEEVLRRVRALGAPCLYVPGNHDLPTLSFPGNVDGTVATIGSVRIAGIGGAGPGRFGFSYEWDEEQIANRVVPECDVILSHTPPARTKLDIIHDGRHVGSESVRAIAARHDGVLVCGHIHEAPGSEQIGRCLCLNVGGLGAPFGLAQVGFVRRSSAGEWSCTHEDLAAGSTRQWTRG